MPEVFLWRTGEEAKSK